MRYVHSYFSMVLFLALLAGLTACSENPPPGNSSGPLNILLISFDDLGYSDLGCYGGEIRTPYIDSLAFNGLRFRQFYNTAKCFPSRAALLTGVYAQDAGYHEDYTRPLRNVVTLGEVLKQAGYRTYWSGKHHGVDNPFDRGFDHYFGLRDGAANHFNPGNQRPGEPAPARKRANRVWVHDDQVYQPYTPEEKDFYSTDYYTKYALEYIRESKEMEKPFFLYLSYTAPHDPLMAWPEDIQKYKGRYDAGYEVIRRQRYEKQLELGLVDSTWVLSDPDFTLWENLSQQEQRYEAQVMEVYAAMIDRLDQNVGRLIRLLQTLNMDENTLIMFVSDNGASSEVVRLKDDNDTLPVGSLGRWVSLGKNWANVSNTPLRLYKNYNYEGGINSPFIVFWPGKTRPGSITDYPGHFIDIMATLTDITGARYPEEFNNDSIIPLRGESLRPVFHGQGQGERDSPLYWEWRGGQAMREGPWKIVRNDRDDPWHLYHMREDPSEMNDLAGRFAGKVNRMDSLYQRWYDQYYAEED